MSQSAKAQEPSMEEILASIRRIIADDETGKGAKAPDVAPAPKPVPTPVASAATRPVPPRPPSPPSPPAAANKQDDIDAMLGLDAPKPAPKPAAPKPAPGPSDVLDLTEAMTASPAVPPGPAFRTIDGASDVVFTERAPDLPEPIRPAPPPSPAPMVDRGLISGATRAAVDSAFNSLANTVLGNNARTLEDLVKEMLRPMLKSWLDDNLPGMVERIVRAEIERVSRGR
jgi:cell pole-organizing protein PopZ